jgi:hypothetical protein
MLLSRAELKPSRVRGIVKIGEALPCPEFYAIQTDQVNAKPLQCQWHSLGAYQTKLNTFNEQHRNHLRDCLNAKRLGLKHSKNLEHNDSAFDISMRFLNPIAKMTAPTLLIALE